MVQQEHVYKSIENSDTEKGRCHNQRKHALGYPSVHKESFIQSCRHVTCGAISGVLAPSMG